jgi:hypothetical protein
VLLHLMELSWIVPSADLREYVAGCDVGVQPAHDVLMDWQALRWWIERLEPGAGLAEDRALPMPEGLGPPSESQRIELLASVDDRAELMDPSPAGRGHFGE